MKCCLKTSVLLTMAFTASAKSVINKYSSKGFSASADVSFKSECPYFYGNYLYAGIYGSASKFQTTGSDGYKETSEYEDVYVDFSTTTCDDTTVQFTYGSVYSYTDNSADAVFGVDPKTLKKSSLESIEMPIYSYSCEYECIEMCYAEIFGYGTCPEDELPYVECYTSVCDPLSMTGVAKISINWVEDGSNTYHSSSVSRSRSGSYSTLYKSKGVTRDSEVSVSVNLNGQELIPEGEPSYSSGYIQKSDSMDIYKSKDQSF